MKNRIKIIFGYALLFIESITLLLITLLLVFRLTIFDKSYIKNQFNKNDYYKKLNKEIKTEMSYYTNQSGFEDNILDDIYSLTDVKNSTNSFISSVYSGEEYKINTSQIEEKLTNNINEVVNNENFKVVNQDDLNKFVKQISSVYSDEIKLMGYLDKICKYIPKVIDLSEYMLVLLFAALVFLFIINEKVFKRKDYSVVLYTASFILLSILIGLIGTIDIKNLMIYSKTISESFISIIKNIFSIFAIIGLVYITIGVIIDLLKKEKRRRHSNATK